MKTAQPLLQHKIYLNADFKLLGDEKGPGGFSGYGSVFHNFDRVNEAVIPGAFSKSLPSFLENGFIAIGHDWSALPVATVSKAQEDEHGLYIEAEFHSTKEAQDARKVVQERMARGKSVGLSIGYRVLDSEETEEGYLLKELDLFEVSLVTVPCNPQASIVGIKGYSLEDQMDGALETVKTLTERVKRIQELRAKDGRSLSDEKMERLTEIQAEVRKLEGEIDNILTFAPENTIILDPTEPLEPIVERRYSPEQLKALQMSYLKLKNTIRI